MSQVSAPESVPGTLKPVRLYSKKKSADQSGGQLTPAPLTPGSAGEALPPSGGLSALPSTESFASDLLACGLYEDELNDLAELLESHSPKSANSGASMEVDQLS